MVPDGVVVARQCRLAVGAPIKVGQESWKDSVLVRHLVECIVCLRIHMCMDWLVNRNLKCCIGSGGLQSQSGRRAFKMGARLAEFPWLANNLSCWRIGAAKIEPEPNFVAEAGPISHILFVVSRMGVQLQGRWSALEATQATSCLAPIHSQLVVKASESLPSI